MLISNKSMNKSSKDSETKHNKKRIKGLIPLHE